jgi:hypothetical protein
MNPRREGRRRRRDDILMAVEDQDCATVSSQILSYHVMLRTHRSENIPSLDYCRSRFMCNWHLLFVVP